MRAVRKTKRRTDGIWFRNFDNSWYWTDATGRPVALRTADGSKIKGREREREAMHAYLSLDCIDHSTAHRIAPATRTPATPAKGDAVMLSELFDTYLDFVKNKQCHPQLKSALGRFIRQMGDRSF